MTDQKILEQIDAAIHLAEYVDAPYVDVPVELLRSVLNLIKCQKVEIKEHKEKAKRHYVFWSEAENELMAIQEEVQKHKDKARRYQEFWRSSTYELLAAQEENEKFKDSKRTAVTNSRLLTRKRGSSVAM